MPIKYREFKQSCPVCSSTAHVEYYSELDYYACKDCGTSWECDKEDPDEPWGYEYYDPAEDSD
jgi:transcription elongation factor Elf1